MLLTRMQEQGLVPNANTYTTLIDGHCKVGNFDHAYELLDMMGKEGVSPNICTYNAIIDGLCKKGRVQEVYTLLKSCFKRGMHVDRVAYTILISDSCNCADTRQALVFFNRVTYIFFLSCCGFCCL